MPLQKYIQTVGGSKGNIVYLVREEGYYVRVECAIGKYRGFQYVVPQQDFDRYYEKYNKKIRNKINMGVITTKKTKKRTKIKV